MERTMHTPNETRQAQRHQYVQAIVQFERDLNNSIDMQDRRVAVQYLATKIGVGRANVIAEHFGLTDSYYRA
jgi:hypothetical protein